MVAAEVVAAATGTRLEQEILHRDDYDRLRYVSPFFLILSLADCMTH